MEGNQTPEVVTPRSTKLVLTTITAGILINIGIGSLIHYLKIPLYLGSIGSILVTLLLGIPCGIATAVLGALVSGFFIDSIQFYFLTTHIVIPITVGLMARRGLFKSIPKTILAGVILGVVAGVVSAPAVAMLGGVTDSGSSNITTFMIASGKSMLKSVFLTGLSCEPIDKTLQCLIALGLSRVIPPSLRRRFTELRSAEAEPITPTGKARAARIGMIMGVVFFFGPPASCYCPGWDLCSGAALILPILYGTRGMKAAAVVLFLIDVTSLTGR